ncbi:MAG: prolyl oligopeptidase family serine peptidase [Planctomycetota bacterium]
MRVALMLLVPFALSPLRAQEPESLTLEKVLQRGGSLLPMPPQVLWIPPGHDATVIVTEADGNQTMRALVAGQPGKEVLFDAAVLGKALGGEGKAPARFPPCRWLDAKTLRVEAGTSVRTWHPGDAEAATVLSWPEPGGSGLFAENAALAIAPGDAMAAYTLEGELWLVDRGGEKHQLTFDGTPDIVYGGAAHRAEFGITTGLWWSGNGRYLAFSREDQRPNGIYPYLDLEPTPPTARHGRYPMAGTRHSKVAIGVCDTATRTVTYLERDPDEDVYWTNIAVADDGTVFTARVDRGQNHLELARFDGATGKPLGVLLKEHDAEWIEPEHPPTILPDGRFLWWSSRDGYKRLWLCAADGTAQHPLHKGPFDVQELLGIEGSTVFFSGAGDDARQLQVFAADLDGSGERRLTKERGVHHAELSPDHRLASLSWSDLESPPSTYLLDLATGAETPPMPTRNPLDAFRLPTQRFFEITAKDGSVLHGHLALPPDLKDGERRPVLLYVYGGPHVQLVTDSWFGGASLWLQALAAEGYVLCRIDNHGTPNRGSEFEQAVFRHLGTKEVEDQLLAIDWLRQQSFVDPARIGVHGWSFGGYMTLRLLLLAPPGTFACGISGAPVTDWAMYETGYTERYMDTPQENPEGYEASSCLPLAAKLQTPLLLVQGTDDRTVMWSHTLRFVDRCIDAGTFLSYFPYPMQKHGLVGRDRVHFLRFLHSYLGEHLHPEVKTAK